MRCEQGNDLLSLVAQLKEAVKRPRSIREYKRGSSLNCSWCALVKDLQKQGVKLQETVKRLRHRGGLEGIGQLVASPSGGNHSLLRTSQKFTSWHT